MILYKCLTKNSVFFFKMIRCVYILYVWLHFVNTFVVALNWHVVLHLQQKANIQSCASCALPLCVWQKLNYLLVYIHFMPHYSNKLNGILHKYIFRIVKFCAIKLIVLLFQQVWFPIISTPFSLRHIKTLFSN